MKIIADIKCRIFFLILWILYFNYVTAAIAFQDGLTQTLRCPAGCRCQQGLQKIHCSPSHIFQRFDPLTSKFKHLHISDILECNCKVYNRLAELAALGITVHGKCTLVSLSKEFDLQEFLHFYRTKCLESANEQQLHRNINPIRIARNSNTSMLRLKDGGVSCGRLEIWSNNQWMRVCNTNGQSGKYWSHLNVEVACRQLHFRGKSFVYDGSAFAPSDGPTWSRAVDCNGNETELSQCRYSQQQSSCSHQSGVGICCGFNQIENPPVSAPIYNNIRLYGGNSAISGQPQFFHQGKWQSICPTGWTENDADVFCRELGYVGADSITAEINGDVTRSTLYYQLSCVGSESSISSCHAKLARNYDISNSCYYPNNPAVARVTCKKSAGNPLNCEFVSGFCNWTQLQEPQAMKWIWKSKSRRFQSIDNFKHGPYVFVQLHNGFIGNKAILKSPLLSKFPATKVTLLMSYYMDNTPVRPALTLLTVEADYPSENQHDVVWFSYPRTMKRWLYSSVMFSPRFQNFHISIKVTKGPELSGFVGLSRIEIIGCNLYRNTTSVGAQPSVMDYLLPISCTAIVFIILTVATLTHYIKNHSLRRQLTSHLPKPKRNPDPLRKRLTSLASPKKTSKERSLNTSAEISKV